MNSSQSVCCVCSKNSTLHPKLVFYRFPPEKNKHYDKWTQFCKVKCKIMIYLSFSLLNLFNHLAKNIKDLRVCSTHFGPEFRVPSLKPRSKLNQRVVIFFNN